MNVLIFCTKGFEMMEVSPFIDVLGWAKEELGYTDVSFTLCGFTSEVVSTFGVTMKMDITIEQVDVKKFDAIAIPGGFEQYGFYEEAYDERFSQLIREFNELEKPVASICVGALALGKSGILTGKKATTYHLSEGRRQKQLAEFGANVVNESVVVTDNLITSWCPQTAPYVALELLELLIGREKTDPVRIAMGFKGERVEED